MLLVESWDTFRVYPYQTCHFTPRLTPKSCRRNQPAAESPQLPNGFGDDHDAATQLRGAAQHDYGRYDLTPNTMPPSAHTTRIADSSAYYQNADDASAALSSYSPPPNLNGQSNSSPSCFRFQPSAAPIATMSSAAVTTDSSIPSAKLGEPNTQVLMSEIERMKKEQKDQKNMLAQILGAVQGFRGSPGSESRAG